MWTRDERSWVIGMTEAGIDINSVILVFMKQLLTEHSIVSGKQGWQETARNRTDRNKLNPLEERFLHITSRRERFLSANPICWYRGSKLSLVHLEDSFNIDILSFSKHFYDRHCAPYQWNDISVATIHTGFVIE